VSDSKRAVLRRVRAFADLGDEECDAVLRVLRARRGAPNDVLFREGDAGDSLMIVLDGELIARVRTAAGTEEDVARLGPGQVVGEMAFIDAEPRSATVVAGNTPVTVLDFTRAALGRLVAEAPRVASAILRNVLVDVARRLREAGETLSDGSIGSEVHGPASLGRGARGVTATQLRNVPAFATYGQEDLELLAHVATLRSFARNDILIRAGDAGTSCFLIATGNVSVHRPGAPGPIATLGPGALVGQLALIDRAPRSATVTATEDTMALELRGDAFTNLVRASSPIALRFQWQVALAGVRQLRTATKKLATTIHERAPSSYDGGQVGHTLGGWDDWDDGAPGSALELADTPRSHR